MGGDFFGGEGVALIVSLCEGVEINFCLMRGGYVFNFLGAYYTHFPTPPSLQVIIAQSLMTTMNLLSLLLR